MANHQNFFSTNPTSNTLAGATTTPLNSIPTCDAPFYLTLDATNVNGHAEIIYVTSKTATSVNHAATSYAHTTAEEVRMDVVADELDSIYDAKLGMASQAIINGNFDIWQRGTSVTPADAAVTWLADHWRDNISKDGGTLPTLTRSREVLTSGDIPNSFYFSRLTTNGAGSGFGNNAYGYYSQKIEHGARNLCGAGKKVTLTFYARSSIANKKLGISVLVSYGTGGSPSAAEYLTVSDPVITHSTSWTKYTYTIETNTLVGKTFGTDNDDSLIIYLHNVWGSTSATTFGLTGTETFVGSGTIDIAQVQLCAGDVALPFQPKSYGEELRACQRYCVGITTTATNETIGFGSASATTNAFIIVHLPVEMRTTPTISPAATAGDWQLYDGVNSPTNLSSIDLTGNSVGYKALTLSCGTASGLTQYRPYKLIGDGTAGRKLILDAEL